MTEISKTKPKRRFARMPASENTIEDNSARSGDIEVSRPNYPIPKPESKAARIVALLEGSEGATLEEMIAVTGWLAHTTRAALTGLRKKGHVINRIKVDGVSRYSIVTESRA